MTSKSNYIFVIVDSQLPTCTKTQVKLHIKCPKIVCGWGSSEAQTPQLTENWIKFTHCECVVTCRPELCLGLDGGGSLYSVPPGPLYIAEGATLRREGGIGGVQME